MSKATLIVLAVLAGSLCSLGGYLYVLFLHNHRPYSDCLTFVLSESFTACWGFISPTSCPFSCVKPSKKNKSANYKCCHWLLLWGLFIFAVIAHAFLVIRGRLRSISRGLVDLGFGIVESSFIRSLASTPCPHKRACIWVRRLPSKPMQWIAGILGALVLFHLALWAYFPWYETFGNGLELPASLICSGVVDYVSIQLTRKRKPLLKRAKDSFNLTRERMQQVQLPEIFALAQWRANTITPEDGDQQPQSQPQPQQHELQSQQHELQSPRNKSKKGKSKTRGKPKSPTPNDQPASSDTQQQPSSSDTQQQPSSSDTQQPSSADTQQPSSSNTQKLSSSDTQPSSSNARHSSSSDHISPPQTTTNSSSGDASPQPLKRANRSIVSTAHQSTGSRVNDTAESESSLSEDTVAPSDLELDDRGVKG